MIVSLIYAQANNGVIGRNNDLPWHLPADLQHFKALTTGHTIIMGRKTYESIGKPLPNRRSIVVTRRRGYQPDGVETSNSLSDALHRCHGADKVFVIGGAELFRDALPRADRVYRTVVHADVPGDVLFPALDPDEWVVQTSENRAPDERNPYPLTFQTLVRQRATPVS